MKKSAPSTDSQQAQYAICSAALHKQHMWANPLNKAASAAAFKTNYPIRLPFTHSSSVNNKQQSLTRNNHALKLSLFYITPV